MNTGIYIHVPFCRSKCSYCSFVSRTLDEPLAERYCRAVVGEIEALGKSSHVRHTVDSIYIGGGTPALLPALQIASILVACRRQFDVVADVELSIEANPGTLTAEKLRVYRSLGINRVSLGAQSFSDEELAGIGRIHSASEIGIACAQLRDCGIENLNLDLILGLPGQTAHQWKANLQSAAALSPSHVSIYMLELDEKVPLFHSLAAGRCHVPDEELVADWYLQSIDFLNDHGLPQYEISNFARPGCECRHNLKYWRREPVLGFGLAAHSYDGTSRSANLGDLSEYLGAVEEGRSPVQWRELLNSIRDLEETIFLGLRLRKGLDWEHVRRSFDSGRVETCEASFKEMAEMGLLEWEQSDVRLTQRGMLLSNEIFQKFVHLG